MCRWFAYLSPTEPCLLADVLIHPANAITKQCSEHYLPKLLPHGEEHELSASSDALLKVRNSLLNMDGTGVAWYTRSASSYTSTIQGLRPAIYKSQSPPTNDYNFRSICDNTESTCVFAHIRATSGTIVTSVNNQPFAFGRHIFMHNGHISDFMHIRRAMADILSYDAYRNIHGTTDSEHCAALFMTNLCGGMSSTADAWQKTYTVDEMHHAMVKTTLTILELSHAALGAKAHAHPLNFAVTDGTKMVALRFCNHKTESPASLYFSTQAGRTLNRKYPGHPDGMARVNTHQTVDDDVETGKHIIVSSEPTTFDDDEWTLVGRNCCILVDEHGDYRQEKVEYEDKFNMDSSLATYSHTMGVW